MPGSQKIIALVGTRDPARAKAFYGGTLGLRLVSQDPFALVFDAVGAIGLIGCATCWRLRAK
jgi:catechol 2,3-dioxygenase-like lactoylglutathione lyase family enzyme